MAHLADPGSETPASGAGRHDEPSTDIRRDILSEVAVASRLREGREGVRSVLREISAREPVPLRHLATAVRLPLPVVVAVVGELSSRNITTRTERGIRFTESGTSFVRDLLGSPTTDTGGRRREPPQGFVELLEDLRVLRPDADVTLDQAKATVETLVRRVEYLVRNDALVGRRLLFLGDDDFVSVAAMRWINRSNTNAEESGAPPITVIELDERICSCIHSLEPAVTTITHDLRHPLPDSVARAFDVIVTDPPYTPQGAELFLSRAAEAASPDGAHCFLSMGHLDPAAMRLVQKAISNIGWVIVEWIPSFNEYEGSSILGNASLMAHLVTAPDIRPAIVGDYEGALYTADLRPVIRIYRCLGCSAEWEVGQGKHWTTVERLKQEHCPLCGSERFLRTGQRAARPEVLTEGANL